MRKKKKMEEEVVKKKPHEVVVVYHERQRLQFCLLHSLNNLFQASFVVAVRNESKEVKVFHVGWEKGAFTRSHLNAIAEKLVLDDPTKGTWTPLSVIFKPHHNAFTGNYDINVLIAAVEEKGKRVVWHDRRSGASSIDLDEPEEKLMGIVLNIPVRKYGGFWKGRHWVSLRKIEGAWYNLDSDLAAPLSFKDTEEVREYLDAATDGGAEVLLVMNE